MAGFVEFSASRLAANSTRGIQTQLRNPPLLIAATVTNHYKNTADEIYIFHITYDFVLELSRQIKTENLRTF